MATKKIAYTVFLELLNSTTGSKWVDTNPSDSILEDITIDIYKDGTFIETVDADSRISDNLVTVNLTGGVGGHTDADNVFLEIFYNGIDTIEINPVQILFNTDLESISTSEPSGRASNFREMLVQLYMRFFNKVDRTTTEIRVYDESSSSVITTQSHTNVSNVTTVDKAP
jgi:hypothetical protein